jgi:hypothetical protein
VTSIAGIAIPGVTGATPDKSAGLPPVSKPRSADMPVTAEPTPIRPFRIEVPEEQLAELRRRIEATRWPTKELVADRSQGVQLATLQALARPRAPGAAAGMISHSTRQIPLGIRLGNRAGAAHASRPPTADTRLTSRTPTAPARTSAGKASTRRPLVDAPPAGATDPARKGVEP